MCISSLLHGKGIRHIQERYVSVDAAGRLYGGGNGSGEGHDGI